jgi:hypothetical protein
MTRPNQLNRSRQDRALHILMMHTGTSPVPMFAVLAAIRERCGDDGIDQRTVRLAVSRQLITLTPIVRGSKTFPAVQLTAAGIAFINSITHKGEPSCQQ